MHEITKIIFIIAIIVVVAVILFFNRAPQRIVPESGIISPASGKVIEVRESENTSIIFQKEGVDNHVNVPEISGPVKVILIQMSPKDVHVQRAPITGSIIRMDHYDGKHRNALGKDELILVEENEKTVTVFKNETDTVGVVQVAGIAARRIRNKSAVGDQLKKGDIYGKILLGSQVVVILPAEHNIAVKVGDRVVDGEIIIAN
jgi:phosphatidylserine decarboxylase